MTDPQYTDITMVLDRSGSMASIREDMMGGFDTFIAEQAQQPGRCTVTLHQFDDRYDTLYVARPIAEVPALELVPRGTTALLDAIGRSIASTGERLAALPEDERPGTVIVGIITDGRENASKEYTRHAIKEMIEHQENAYDWSFTYLGANQDAVEVGRGLGIRDEASLTYSTGATDAAMSTYASSVTALRAGRARGMSTEDARRSAAYTDEQRDSAVDG